MSGVIGKATNNLLEVFHRLQSGELDALLNSIRQYVERRKTLSLAIAVVSVLFIGRRAIRPRRPAGYLAIPEADNWKVLKTMFTTDSVTERRKPFGDILQKHGIVRMKLVGQDMVHFATPEYAKKMLTSSDVFLKESPEDQGKYTLSAKFLGGVNLVFSNGGTWRRHRKIANPAFHRNWDTDVFGHCVRKMSNVIDASMAKEGKVDLGDVFTRMTLDALGLAGFGFDFKSLENPDGEYVKTYNTLMNASLNPLYFLFPILDRFPLGARRKLHTEAVIKYDNLLFDIIKAKQADVEAKRAANGGTDMHDKDDLLTMMIKACYDDENKEGGKGLNLKELRDNVAIFFLAGHDTTANALASAIYFLARNPEYQQRLFEEAIEALGPIETEEDELKVPTFAQTKQMPFLDLVMKETLRLRPSVGQLPARKTAQEVDMGDGYIIPKGIRCTLNIHSIHHNPKYWGDDVEEFKPDRFQGNALTGEKSDGYTARGSYEWLAFSNGPRSCIGTNFSLIEQRVTLSMLVRKYTFKLPEDSIWKDHLDARGVVLQHIHDLYVEFHPRQ
ncbi:hypothetical protein BZG36_01487 [Bifiguratus adelaidae]|uniref:Cytochrome P450 n=1 Tax=Bifiguratus adelaidae TaxID=1938954 RepID=A0A261Y4R4_9FUNG|nr:hypothetical protein BZG36_01487 [Bifiguratus adelaidae]